MRIADRLGQKSNPSGVAQSPPTPAIPVRQPQPVAAPVERVAIVSPPSSPVVQTREVASREVVSILSRLHQKILDRLDLAAVSQLAPEELRKRLKVIVDQVVANDRISVSDDERNAVTDSIVNELVGLGPLESILKDPTVSDVLVNGCNKVWIERGGKLAMTDIRFRDDRHLIHTIQRICARIGRRVDESSPMVDARLADGSRVNAVIPPLAIDGPALSIRRFGNRPLRAEDLVARGAFSPEMLEYLDTAVRSRCSILISGGTGAGKTTMLNCLSSFIPGDERIITVEDAAELRLVQPHVVRLESRPSNLEGKGEVTIRDLVRNALRMRPDRIVVGEVRGGEVLDMLQAMNTGHEGSMATVHSNSTRDAINRLVTMLGMTGTPFSEETMKTMIGRAIHIIIQVSRMQDGMRRIVGISEVTGQMGATIQLHDVFQFERTGTGPQGQILGGFKNLSRTALQHMFKNSGQGGH